MTRALPGHGAIRQFGRICRFRSHCRRLPFAPAIRDAWRRIGAIHAAYSSRRRFGATRTRSRIMERVSRRHQSGVSGDREIGADVAMRESVDDVRCVFFVDRRSIGVSPARRERDAHRPALTQVAANATRQVRPTHIWRADRREPCGSDSLPFQIGDAGGKGNPPRSCFRRGCPRRFHGAIG